jgi:hypothetical protein
MALLVQVTRSARPNIQSRAQTHRSPARRRVKTDRLKLCPRPKNRGEKTIAKALIDADIAFTYEPRSFNTGQPGKGRGSMRPDFYLPELELYLEVTQGDDFKEAFKEAKLEAAQRKNEILILLIGRQEIEAIRRGQQTIEKLIEVLYDLAQEKKTLTSV